MAPGTLAGQDIYRRLKILVTSGRLAPGKSLVVPTIAAEFDVSTSPVRDGLHRLQGERMLVPHRGGGFEIPQFTHDALRDLYIWHGKLVRMALKDRRIPNGKNPMFPRAWPNDYSTPDAIADTTGIMFKTMVERAGSPELTDAVRAAGERLRTTRLLETERWTDVAREIDAVRLLAISGTRKQLLEAIWLYHRRRIRAASTLLHSKTGQGQIGYPIE